ncbi:DUF397 domain-containing protein [Nocardia otitidiscaviarum]|uniref:DUF397 domain-containing protein n=1 Tax=Nocardia otitidiscaviarum TaxID=1823 RepID=UPI001893CF73|nr:DUF397 domain-containing protein [Nocardia otitidiscaviarum]MBF6179809.1 DUF397 domain-containing protein [Nocardia otitidiscaviarum]
MGIDLSDTHWFKSSHSQHGGECVEIAYLDGGMVGVRDSKNPTGPALIFTASEWSAFTTRVSTGELHRPN